MGITADLILTNASIITCAPGRRQAEAIAIRGDRISLVGTNKEVAGIKSPASHIIDCQGKTLVPGFNDAHCHLYPLVRKFFSLDLSPAAVKSIKDIQDRISCKAKFTPQGRWISGAGYNEFYLAEKRHPTRWDLDDAAPHHPVVLTHRSLHAAVLNSLALKMLGIASDTEEPPGGIIDRDLDTGEPSGILYEMGEYIRLRAQFPISDEEMEWGISMINREFLSQGITSIGEASISNNLARWQTYRKLKKSGKLRNRVYMMAGMEFFDEFKNAGLITGSGDSGLKVGSLKIVLSETTGNLSPSQPELNQLVLNACRAGFQVAIHAVERSTVEAAVEALEYAHLQFPQNDQRHRIEHASECPPEIRSRLSALKAVVVSQPPFIYYSGERYLSQVSDETQQWLYPFKSLMDSGVAVAGSSDAPVALFNPLMGIYSAVTRRAETGQVVLPEEAVTPGQALQMYTFNAAYATFEEDIKGTLASGKLADIVMLSADPLHSNPEQIKDIKVEMTILDGEVVYSSPAVPT